MGPEELFDKVVAARTYRAGTQMCRQVHFSLSDLLLHSEYACDNGKSGITAFDIEKQVVKKTAVLPTLPYDRFLCSFMHIFGGGYAAGYFSYKWAEVLSADCFAAFEEVGLENDAKIQETGLHFRDTILSLGGGIAPAEVFHRFRGRDPNPEALLRHSGLLRTGGEKVGGL